MKLKDLLGDKELYIEYRTNSPLSSEEDILAGSCRWDGAKLYPIDKDSYSTEDEISKYEIENDKNIIVWYESIWI